MKYLPANTLAHFAAAPQTHQHDFSELPVAVIAESTQQYKASCNHASPDDEAVTFYTLNHCVSIVRKLFTANEPLPEWARTIMQSYTDACMGQGERLLHYILCITAREMRHLKTHGKPNEAFWTKVGKDFGPEMKAFLQLIASNGSEETAMGQFLTNSPNATVGTYLQAMSHAFHHANGWNGEHVSYGGKKWGLVVDAAFSMLTGVTSMEMLVDTGYTLAHNGGPIFNKGMMYSHHGSQLITVLDVQRAGQMLDLMAATETLGIKKTPEAIAAYSLIKEHCPEELKGFVDWKAVDAQRPDKDHNPSKYSKVVGAQKQASKPVVEKPQVVTVQGKQVKVTGTYQVFPHQTVTTFERIEK